MRVWTRKVEVWATVGLLAIVMAAVWLALRGDSLAFDFKERSPGGTPSGTSGVEQARTGQRANRLIHEKSPYLLQHAYNPVDWYPWGQEAFEKARREQKPIFLSVGYSTCHWCHVMERESFSDHEIATIMNRDFVAIKVDREERPDVDQIYMSFVQATTGGGGWPMSVFLTPELKPFFGGTYFPKDDRYGLPGFRTVLTKIAQIWRENRESVLKSADRVTTALQGIANPEAATKDALGTRVLDTAYEQIAGQYDSRHGGFGSAPKFPRPVVFNFLFRYYARTGKNQARDMSLHTLRAMARGGMHDHVGGGFHRYSTDERWHVPHFEKMMYDQAQLASSYVDAYQVTRDAFFAGVARDVLEYVLRDMRDAQGGFYSAEDADSLLERGKPEHAEGAFYVWTADELKKLLGEDVAAVFSFYHGVEPSGNVPLRQDIQGELRGKNILIVEHTLAETAKKFGRREKATSELLAAARQKLFQVRSQRPRPPRDDKVLTAWNGLMISALARAGQVLNEPRYLQTAEAAARFLRTNLYEGQSVSLKRRYRTGSADIDGFVDDYAFLIQGLLDLYEATFDVDWLTWAVRLQEKQDALFWDPKQGGYFSTTGKDPALLLRMRDVYDGAEPSPNSVAALNLLRLWQMTDREKWREMALKTFTAFGQRLTDVPQAVPQLAAAFDFSQSKAKQIVIAGDLQSPDTKALLRLVHERYIPNKILLLADGAAGQKQLVQWLPFIKGVTRRQGRATAYICEDYVCKLPTSDPQVVARLLDQAE
ncbi:MAG: thioredoxin domain-containing protein [Acidobacteria bacterium]|nr:thioredoxin domain-containing protein [Acidobacteriota bacterium]